jgi:hypothetical protein
MIERTKVRFDLQPRSLPPGRPMAPAACWRGRARGIEPHIPLLDRASQAHGMFTREDSTFDRQHPLCVRCVMHWHLRGEELISASRHEIRRPERRGGNQNNTSPKSELRAVRQRAVNALFFHQNSLNSPQSQLRRLGVIIRSQLTERYRPLNRDARRQGLWLGLEVSKLITGDPQGNLACTEGRSTCLTV